MRAGFLFSMMFFALAACAARAAEAEAEKAKPEPLDAVERERVWTFVHRAPIFILGRAASVRPIKTDVSDAEWLVVRVEVEAFLKGKPVGIEERALAPKWIEFLVHPVAIVRGSRLVSALDRTTLLPEGARGFFALCDRREHPKFAEAEGAAARIRYAPAPRETYAPCLPWSEPVDAAVREWLALAQAFAHPKLAEEGSARVRALVLELGSEDFETREAAQKKLAAFGWRANKLVRELGEKHKDREVRRRSAEVLDLYAKEMTPAAAAAAEGAKPAPPAPLAP